jgi:predicted GIY-YIG superfamily endonuclease
MACIIVIFYFGSTKNLRTGLKFHNEGKVMIFGDGRADLSKLNIV